MSVQSKLSDKAIKNLKPKDKKYKVGDGDRLWLAVMPTGAKSWLYLWRQDGSLKEMTVGPYPAISLKQARQERDRLNSITAMGKDPREERRNSNTSRRNPACPACHVVSCDKRHAEQRLRTIVPHDGDKRDMGSGGRRAIMGGTGILTMP